MRAHPKLDKARLFRSLDESAPKAGGPPKTAILNLDDPSYAFLRDATSARPVTYGSEPKADVHLESLESGEDGISLRILAGGQSTQVRSGLIGAYNAANILAAFATTVAGLGIVPSRRLWPAWGSTRRRPPRGLPRSQRSRAGWSAST